MSYFYFTMSNVDLQVAFFALIVGNATSSCFFLLLWYVQCILKWQEFSRS